MLDETLKAELKGFWAVAWRMLVVAPLVFPLGTIVFVIAIIAPFLLPVAGLLIYQGDYLYGGISLVAWIVWFIFRQPLNRFVFEGFEHSGM